MLSVSSLVAGLLLAVAPVLSLPFQGTGETVAVSSRQTSLAAPWFVAYSDEWVSGEDGPPAPSVIEGFNVFVLSFLMTSGAVDQADEWVLTGNATRASIKAEYEAAGIKLMVSAFGSTDAPTSDGYDPTTLAQTMAAWVVEYGLDGIDIDYEDFNAMNAQDGSAEDWLITFTTTLRELLPSPTYIITHAPVAPWFSAAQYASGAYVTVNNQVGQLIDWYNVQFYNQGTEEYVTCEGLLDTSSTTWPDTALFQINSVQGVDLQKLVIGKPAIAGDASNGYINTTTLATCVEQAKAAGWQAGVMTWEYPDAASAWIEAVRADSWPVN